MKYRALGATGLEVSEIVFGGGAVGGLLIRSDPETRVAAVRRALDLGINWFDTAPSYGDGQSEENLGAALQELKASPHVSTKVSLRPEHMSDVPGEIRRSVEDSLRRLQRDKVDVVILHNPTTETRGARRVSMSEEDVLGKNGVVDGFETLRDEGLTSFFGFTASGDVPSLRRLIESGRFHVAQVFHSLVNPTAGRLLPSFPGQNYEDLIQVAVASSVGVFNIRVLAAGAVVGGESASGARASAALGQVKYEAGDGSREATPGTSVDEAVTRMAAVGGILKSADGTDAQKAVRFALANPGVSGVLVGFSTQDHIDEAVAAVDMGPIPAEAMHDLEALYASMSS